MAGPAIALLLTEPFDPTFRTTGGFAAAYSAEANNAYGEQLVPLLGIRLNDGVGGIPSTKLLPTSQAATAPFEPFFGGERIIEVNPITRKREVEFGIVQGGAWQIRATNNNEWWGGYGYDYRGCWAAIYGDFAGVGYTSIYAQGRITRFSYESDGTVMIEIQEAIMDILKSELPRDIRFQSTGWLSDMNNDQRASGSKSYDSTYLTTTAPQKFADETFIVEFTTATAYKVILEDGDETQTSPITSSIVIYNIAGETSILQIGTAGWDTTTSGAYTAGDRFVFYTAAARTTTQLTPVWMVSHLLDDVLGLTVYDVDTGTTWPSARYDATQWSAKSAAYATYSIYGLQGFWRKGTPYSRLIQDALKVVHGSIFPSQDGRIELWVLDAGSELSLTLNGNPADGQVDIMASRAEQDMRDVVSSVTFNYLSITDEADAAYTATDSDPTWLTPRYKTVDIGWEVQGGAIESACNIYLNRFKAGIQRYYLTTTLTGASAEIGKQVRFSDSIIGASSAQSDITEVSVDLMGNSAAIAAYIDPVSLEDYAIVGKTLVGSTTEVVW